jgi:hypothetical protein
MVRRTCASTMGYYMCGTTSVHWCAGAVALAWRRSVVPVLALWRRSTVALLCQDLHDLEVGYIVFIVNAHAGA